MSLLESSNPVLLLFFSVFSVSHGPGVLRLLSDAAAGSQDEGVFQHEPH